MKVIQIYQADAFTNECFKGNPAAVCFLEEDIDDQTMQLISREMNLSETAFIKSIDGKPFDCATIFSLRWFTPKYEVDLCGHATIAASEILFNNFKNINKKVIYETKSGRLDACKTDNKIALNFALDEPKAFNLTDDILKVLGIENYRDAFIGKNTKKLVIRLENETAVLKLSPNFEKMKRLKIDTDVKGIGVTCRGNDHYDFVSRYFNPWAGVNEDPVTGSVHTLLASYWGKLLNKNEMKSYQASDRGGEIILRILPENRLELIGQAVVVLKGEIYIPDKSIT